MKKKLNPEQILLCHELNKIYYSYLLKIMKDSIFFMPGITMLLSKFFVPDAIKLMALNFLGLFIILFTLFKILLVWNNICKLSYKQLISDIGNERYLTEICSLISYRQQKYGQYNISTSLNDNLIVCHKNCLKEILFQNSTCKIISFYSSNHKIAIPIDISRLLFDINI